MNTKTTKNIFYISGGPIMTKITNLIPIPARARLFLGEELKKQNIEHYFYRYDEPRDDQFPEIPLPKCTLHGKEFSGNKVDYIAVTLSKEEIFALIEKIEKEHGWKFD